MDKQRISLGRIIGKIWVGTAFVAGLAVCAAAERPARASLSHFHRPIRPARLLSSRASVNSISPRERGPPAYPIAIGRAGKAWQGATFVEGKFVSPAWSAPWVVRRYHPALSRVIPGGSPRNPMGAAAITLDLSEVAIHGTSASMRVSVGTAASYGCIRMYNEDVVDLYHRVEVGTPVVAIPGG